MTPGKAGISGLHSRLPRGVRPRLEGKPRTPLSSRVATRVSCSPLRGLKGPWDFPGKSTGVGCHCFLRHLDLASSKSLLSCLFKAQLLEIKSCQLLGTTYNLLCNLLSYYDTSYLLVCNWIFKMQSESPFICSFIRHSLNALDTQWCKS